jgi:hypothetical protein
MYGTRVKPHSVLTKRPNGFADIIMTKQTLIHCNCATSRWGNAMIWSTLILGRKFCAESKDHNRRVHGCIVGTIQCMPSISVLYTSLGCILLQAKSNDNIAMMDTKCNNVIKSLVL